jgi:hypothetical protein
VSTWSERGGRGSLLGGHRGKGCWRVKLYGGGELEMVVADGGALEQDRGKAEGKLWCEESRGIGGRFIGPGGVQGEGGTGEETLNVYGGNDARL